MLLMTCIVAQRDLDVKCKIRGIRRSSESSCTSVSNIGAVPMGHDVFMAKLDCTSSASGGRVSDGGVDVTSSSFVSFAVVWMLYPP